MAIPILVQLWGIITKKAGGVDINFDRAIKLLAPACEAKKPNTWACEKAGDVYTDANSIYRANKYDELEDWYGYKVTMSPSRDIKSDGNKSAFYYDIACFNDRASACSKLGFAYNIGSHGLKENQAEATKAYNTGCTGEKTNQGNCYQAGIRQMEGRGSWKKTLNKQLLISREGVNMMNTVPVMALVSFIK